MAAHIPRLRTLLLLINLVCLVQLKTHQLLVGSIEGGGDQGLQISNNHGIFLFELGSWSACHGMGSITLSLLLLKAYYEETQNRTFVLDQSRLKQYRRNETHGLYSGFLTADFAVLDERYTNNRKRNVITRPAGWSAFDDGASSSIEKLSHGNMLGWMKFEIALIQAFTYFTNIDSSNAYLFGRGVPLACSIRINTETDEEIAQLLRNRSIPSLLDENDDTGTSVAFHIRRGDKLYFESRAYQAKEYVDELVRVVSVEEKQSIRTCYVATDNFRAVSELSAALRDASIDCTVHTLANTYATHRNGHHALLLLADLHMLVHATFFVGTFNSNIGCLVSLWRGCDYDDDAPRQSSLGASRANRYNHFYRSYGVDAEEWSVPLGIFTKSQVEWLHSVF